MDRFLDRRTIRKYTSQDIDKKTLDYIINAGIRSSNCGTMQLYSIIVTKDKEKKQQLGKLHFSQPMVENAPVVLTVCADVNRFHHWCRLNNADESLANFMFLNISTIDATICSQAMAAAAEAKGLGICFLGTVNYMAKEIAEFFSLPEGVVPVTTITLGYPDENPPLTERLPMEAVVHYETYKDYTDEDIKNLYAEMEHDGKNIAFVKENNLENLAQVFSQVRYPKKMNEEFSEIYRKFVKDRFIK